MKMKLGAKPVILNLLGLTDIYANIQMCDLKTVRYSLPGNYLEICHQSVLSKPKLRKY